MKTRSMVYAILVFGIIVSVTTPHLLGIVFENNNKTYTSDNSQALAGTKEEVDESVKAINEASNTDLAIASPVIKEEKKEEVKEEEVTTKEEETQEVSEETVSVPVKEYSEMTTDELISAIASGTYKLEYSASYDTKVNKLTKSKGAIYYGNHKETYYSQRVLPGSSLRIPGRHVADDGTVRDGDGYISVAANSSYLAKGTVVKTSLGPGKVYDSGCASGIIDIYTNW